MVALDREDPDLNSSATPRRQTRPRSDPKSPKSAPAAVTKAAQHGGRVIVTFKQQFPQLKQQGTKRTSSTRSSQ
ncbi:hypothetical protein, partial [Jatrophihabitans endophyticus]|uniref:hypothetical protein n=1 Tax=Jatrophihabitans endophyticus TaxID=1206085 RepID=UPI0026F0939B